MEKEIFPIASQILSFKLRLIEKLHIEYALIFIHLYRLILRLFIAFENKWNKGWGEASHCIHFQTTEANNVSISRFATNNRIESVCVHILEKECNWIKAKLVIHSKRTFRLHSHPFEPWHEMKWKKRRKQSSRTRAREARRKKTAKYIRKTFYFY